MAQYLTRYDLIEVDDSGGNIGAYTKRVNFVEVVDRDGNPINIIGNDIGDIVVYPPAPGSTCFRVTFPHDLGPAVTTPTTNLYDLREDCGDPQFIDLLFP